jgi:hypothetical protein
MHRPGGSRSVFSVLWKSVIRPSHTLLRAPPDCLQGSIILTGPARNDMRRQLLTHNQQPGGGGGGMINRPRIDSGTVARVIFFTPKRNRSRPRPQATLHPKSRLRSLPIQSSFLGKRVRSRCGLVFCRWVFSLSTQLLKVFFRNTPHGHFILQRFA